MSLKLHRSTLAVTARSDEGVERPAPGEAPTAFRIWRAGENKCDDGSIFFTPGSADLLMSEQASKGRPLSIDFDHLSLADDRPAEAGRAAGWHQIEARQTDAGPELWAVNVDWCADVKSGLEEQPPRWRFFSPAFYADEESQEVTSYINLALCINPMTHGIPLLASRKLTTENGPMDQIAQLNALIDATQDPDAKAALVAARDALSDKLGVDGGDKPADDAPPVVTNSESADPPAPKKDDDESKDAVAHAHAVKATGDDPVAALTAKVMRLERNAEITAIDALLAASGKLPDEFKAHCRTKSLADAKVMVATVVGATKTHAVRHNAPSQGSPNGSSEMDPREGDALDRAMGIPSTKGPSFFERRADGTAVFHNVRPSDLARMNAQKGKS